MLDNFWETALAIGWKDMVDWKETPPTSRTSLLSSNSFAEASISASQYTPDTAGVDALLGAALGGPPPVPSSASESAASPEKSCPAKAKLSTDIMSGMWNQDIPVFFSPTRAASVSSLTSAMLGSPGANSAQQEVEFHQQALSVLVPTSSSSSTAISSSPVQGMTIHKSVRICPVCTKRITADNLTRHEKSHGSVRPLHCDLCGLKFSRKDCLKKHRELHCKRFPHQ